MNRNKTVSIALVICYIILGLSILLVAIWLIVVVHWHYSPDAYQRVDVTQTLKAGYGLGDIKLYLKKPPLNEAAIYLNQLDASMLYWLTIRTFIFLGINVMIIRSIIKILQSIQDLKTFYDGNITYLKAIAKYGFLATLLSFFNISYFQSEFDFHFTIPFAPLILASLALVLAEVFKEGKLLLEDKNLII